MRVYDFCLALEKKKLAEPREDLCDPSGGWGGEGRIKLKIFA
jgi:hypothetical protein